MPPGKTKGQVMKPLDNEDLAACFGGFAPVNQFPSGLPQDDWMLQLFMNQLAHEQEVYFLREILGTQAA
jgi:hypothetical protein